MTYLGRLRVASRLASYGAAFASGCGLGEAVHIAHGDGFTAIAMAIFFMAGSVTCLVLGRFADRKIEDSSLDIDPAQG